MTEIPTVTTDKDFFETMCRISPVGLFRTDKNGLITYVNQKYEEIAKVDRKDILGVGWFDAVHKDDVGKVNRSWFEAIDSNKDWKFEFRFRSIDGIITWVFGQAAIINGGGKGYVGTITDISYKKNLLHQLLNMQAEMVF